MSGLDLFSHKVFQSLRHEDFEGPKIGLLMRPERAARNAVASDALDAAVKIAFLSAFRTESRETRYCALRAARR
jgi:hypothetical protein